MALIDIWYEGELSTRCVHRDSGAEIMTDAPKDNQGRGRMFSPTDLIAVGLGSCILTVMGIMAKSMKLDISGTKMTVSKEMQSAPSRRIGKIKIELFCPQEFDPASTKRLEKAAEGCPVHHSLHPDIQQEILFHWGRAP